MGSISSGVGLISGLDIQGLVTQLMAIESRPVELLRGQIAQLDAERSAFMAISAKLMALKLAVTPFKSGFTFRPNTATSSNEDVLAASASSAAAEGSYSFRVHQLVQTHQLVSSGFNDPALSGLGSGTISIEIGNGRLDRDTELSILNDHQGVRRGIIRITDRSGASGEIDLTSAVTVSDVLEKINAAGSIDVTASTSGGRIVLTDNTGQSLSNLIVEDVAGGFTAADLGIAGAVSADRMTGQDVIAVTDETPLSMLNDGNGVRTSSTGADLQIRLGPADTDWIDVDFAENLTWDTSLSLLNKGQGVRLGSIKITDRTGAESIIDLTGAQTVDDVQQAITTASGASVAIVGSHLMITDTTDGTGALKIENYGGSLTATDLGIEGESEEGKSSIVGEDIFFFLGTVGDVIARILDAVGPELTVQVGSDGKRLELTSSTGFLEVTSANGSHTAEDLGIVGASASGQITGRRLMAGLNTVLLDTLNGGSGVGLGQIEIQDRTGATASVDLTSAETLDDVLDAINNATVNVRAELNGPGTGIIVRDLTGATASNFRISDVNSTTAADLNIAVDGTVDFVDAGNNQLQYISEATLLSELNHGRGISAGQILITDSTGHTETIGLVGSDIGEMTVGDVIDTINERQNLHVVASINSTGDGILLTDTGGGAGTLQVQDGTSSTTASDLRLAGSAPAPGSSYIDGSYEYRLNITGSDSLQTVVDRLKEMDAPVEAAIINDGSQVNGYRLSLTSGVSGKVGRIVYNPGGTDLDLFDLARPQDAVISFGGGGAANTIVVSSNSNTFENTVPGLTLAAQAVSGTPVTVTVSRDIDAVVDKVDDFVEKFNEVLDSITEYTSYNPETEEAGVLLGSLKVDSVRNRLYDAVRSSLSGVGDIQRLGELGISIGSGAKLNFDGETFREKYNTDPEAIEEFFSTFDENAYNQAKARGPSEVEKFYAETDMGFAYVMERVLDRLTSSEDGLITRTTDNYQDRKDVLNDRIADLEELLSTKEERLYREFYNMELALSRLQSIQSALLSFTPIQPISVTNTTNTGGLL